MPHVPVTWGGARAHAKPRRLQLVFPTPAELADAKRHTPAWEMDDRAGDTLVLALDEKGRIRGHAIFEVKGKKKVHVIQLSTTPTLWFGEGARGARAEGREPEYVGSTVLRFIAACFPGRDIELDAVDTARGFYEKMGFAIVGRPPRKGAFLARMKRPADTPGAPDLVTCHAPGGACERHGAGVGETVIGYMQWTGARRARIRDLTFDVGRRGRVRMSEGGRVIADVALRLPEGGSASVRRMRGSADALAVLAKFLRNTFPCRQFEGDGGVVPPPQQQQPQCHREDLVVVRMR